METIGNPATIVSDEAGEEYQLCFTDNPLSRQIFAIYDACHMFGLDDEERAVLLFLYLYSRKIEGVEMRRFAKARVYRRGVDRLIARGWIVVEKKVAHAAVRPEWETIFKAVEAAKLFGAHQGRAWTGPKTASST